jgi:1-phosphofructokinase family hexose kinase
MSPQPIRSKIRRPVVLITALNPSIDCEWEVKKVRWEEKNIIDSERRWAGGKGVNVARWSQHLRRESRLLIPLGGRTGKELADFLCAEKLSARVLSVKQPTRVNVIITTASQGQLRFNPKGPELSASEWQSVIRAAKAEVRQAAVLVLSGGLPRGLPTDAYAQLLTVARRIGKPCFLDCDGAALTAAIRGAPFLVKPNEHELAEWRGKPLASIADVLNASRALADATQGWVLVSRGDQPALLVHAREQRQLSATPPSTQTLNTVGAGDAMLAGVVDAFLRGSPPEEWLRWGVAAGTAATQCAAGELPALSMIRKIAEHIEIRAAR